MTVAVGCNHKRCTSLGSFEGGHGCLGRGSISARGAVGWHNTNNHLHQHRPRHCCRHSLQRPAACLVRLIRLAQVQPPERRASTWRARRVRPPPYVQCVKAAIELCLFCSLAFDVRKQTQGGHGMSLSGPQTSRTPVAPARARPTPGERGVTVWDGNRTGILHSRCKNADKGLWVVRPQVRLMRPD